MLLNDPSDVRFDDIVASSDTDVPNENCGDLLKYFSKEDLDWDDDDALMSEDGGEMKAIMVRTTLLTLKKFDCVRACRIF
jgi:hypothetical protein